MMVDTIQKAGGQKLNLFLVKVTEAREAKRSLTLKMIVGDKISFQLLFGFWCPSTINN